MGLDPPGRPDLAAPGGAVAGGAAALGSGAPGHRTGEPGAVIEGYGPGPQVPLAARSGPGGRAALFPGAELLQRPSFSSDGVPDGARFRAQTGPGAGAGPILCQRPRDGEICPVPVQGLLLPVGR